MVEPEDCQKFDYVLVADEGHLRALRGLCSGDPQKVRLLLDYAPDLPEREILDPYFGGPDGFEYIMDLVEMASEGLLADIRGRHLSRRV